MSTSRPTRHLLVAALLTAWFGGVGGAPGARTARADEEACETLLRQANAQVLEAERRYEQGDIPRSKSAAIQALALADKAFTRCPTSLDACAMGVFAAVFQGDFVQGSTWLDRYAAQTAYGERDPRLHYLRAMVQARLVRRYDLALRSLERMHAIEPRLDPEKRDRLYIDTLMLWGAELSKAERYDDAIRQFQTAAMVARRAGRPLREIAARVNMGITYSRDGRFEKAAEIFQALHKEAPENPIWSYQLGLQLAGLNRFPEAIEAYRHSIAKQATFVVGPLERDEVLRARLRLGNCLKLHSITLEPAQRAKLLQQAHDELQAYVRLRPDDPLGHLYVGMLLYEERRDFVGALGYFRRAFELDRMCENMLRFLLNAHAEIPAPPKPAGAAPSADEQAAWLAERAAFQKDLDDNRDVRKRALDARVAEGEVHGGCQ